VDQYFATFPSIKLIYSWGQEVQQLRCVTLTERDGGRARIGWILCQCFDWKWTQWWGNSAQLNYIIIANCKTVKLLT